MKTLKEFLDTARQNMDTPAEVEAEKYTPQSLSPIHFSGKSPEEMHAYKLAFNEFLKYYGKDQRRADHFGDMLHAALVKNSPAMLKLWYNVHQV